jgi:hypothetical protein
VVTKKSYEDYLNELGVPEEEKKSNGGRISDNARYGSWLRRNDSVSFHVGLTEYERN